MKQATLVVLIFGIGAAIGGLIGGILGQKAYNRNPRLLPLFIGACQVEFLFPKALGSERVSLLRSLRKAHNQLALEDVGAVVKQRRGWGCMSQPMWVHSAGMSCCRDSYCRL